MSTKDKCPIHGENCPGDDGGFLFDGNHPDDMFGVHLMENKMNGTVIRVVRDRRFGFIKGEDNKDYFFHEADLNGFFDDLVQDLDLNKRVDVIFDSVPSPKGLRAGAVVRVDGGTGR